MTNWNIKILDTGMSEIDKSNATYLEGCGKKIKVPNMMFFVEGEKKIIIDTSFESVQKTWEIHRQKVWRKKDQEIENAFKKNKIRFEEIDYVIFTHLHYDHCGNNKFFENAKFIVQREEIRFALIPLPGMETAYFSPLAGVQPSYLGTDLEIIDGDKALCEGIRIITTPGHTPGSQSVLVKTKKGICCITGDAVMLYENIEKNIPVGSHINLIDCFKSMDKIREYSDYYIPAHDSMVLKKQNSF
jgi:glyoxylase-like metal-dependent hydrolase (beta-lactamase superfamily II)